MAKYRKAPRQTTLDTGDTLTYYLTPETTSDYSFRARIHPIRLTSPDENVMMLFEPGQELTRDLIPGIQVAP